MIVLERVVVSMRLEIRLGVTAARWERRGKAGEKKLSTDRALQVERLKSRYSQVNKYLDSAAVLFLHFCSVQHLNLNLIKIFKQK